MSLRRACQCQMNSKELNHAYLCLGGNIGDRKKILESALFIINDTIGTITAKSAIYETEAWGVENHHPYLNQCILVSTSYNAFELISYLLNIESQLGRERVMSDNYCPRTLDIDILLFNNEIINYPNLIVPHPRLHLRNFVLKPLKEIAPNLSHPMIKKTITQLLDICPDDCIVKLFNPIA